MAQKGQITLKQGTGKTSGKPYTALQLVIGKYKTLHFVSSSFDLEYLAKYLTTNGQIGEITLRDAESVNLTVGDWEDVYTPQTKFEMKYIYSYLSAEPVADKQSTILDDDEPSGFLD